MVDKAGAVWYNVLAVIYGKKRKVTDTIASSAQKICADQSFGQDAEAPKMTFF